MCSSETTENDFLWWQSLLEALELLQKNVEYTNQLPLISKLKIGTIMIVLKYFIFILLKNKFFLTQKFRMTVKFPNMHITI